MRSLLRQHWNNVSIGIFRINYSSLAISHRPTFLVNAYRSHSWFISPTARMDNSHYYMNMIRISQILNTELSPFSTVSSTY
jgi:hypothetical protein